MTLSPPRIYLDYNATAPLRSSVKARAVELLDELEAGRIGNASSIHWAGRAAKKRLEDARSRIAAALGRKPSHLIFTQGGSEADNLAILGTVGEDAARFRIVTSSVEHPAVRESIKRASLRGAEVVVIPTSHAGSFDLEAFDRALHSPRRVLVSVMAVNNETGIVHPVGEIVRLARARDAIVHVDAIQAAGRIPIPAEADFVALSAHKLGGLAGTGALALSNRASLTPQVVGGAQERGLRAGTESIVGPVAMAAALEAAERERATEMPRLGALRDRIDAAFRLIDDVAIVGEASPRVAQTTTAVFGGIEGDSLVQLLDLEGFAVSAGSACASGSLEPSHVLVAMGVPPERALAAIRVSLGHRTTELDVERFLEVLPKAVARCRSLRT
ncbi:MAG: cysteine desulfurase [Deltaproteobacteria bacterium]|nr:cysteine desulfurase [Deltaproteobacteria bacterium]